MATYRTVVVDIPESLRLFDLMGVKTDLTRCDDHCRKMIEAKDNINTEAFFISAIILYGRVFNGGVRSLANIPIEMESPGKGAKKKDMVYRSIDEGGLLTVDEYKFHGDVLNLRSKHIAHSINDMEVQKLCVWLNPEERGRKINTVSAANSYISNYGGDFCARIMSLTKKFHLWVSVEISKEEHLMTDIVKREFTLDYLYSLKDMFVEHGDFKKVRDGRTRLKK